MLTLTLPKKAAFLMPLYKRFAVTTQHPFREVICCVCTVQVSAIKT